MERGAGVKSHPKVVTLVSGEKESVREQCWLSLVHQKRSLCCDAALFGLALILECGQVEKILHISPSWLGNEKTASVGGLLVGCFAALGMKKPAEIAQGGLVFIYLRMRQPYWLTACFYPGNAPGLLRGAILYHLSMELHSAA